MSESVLECRGLRKIFTSGPAPVEVLKGIDLQVQRGERVAIVGASGSGKSTLLHCLGEWNRLDAYTLDFHRRVRAGYLELARAEPRRWVVIDAGQEWERVQQDLREVILQRLAASKS